MNKLIVTGTGRLVQDPELKSTKGGTYYCQLSLAFDTLKRVGDKYETESNFINGGAFGKLAERIAQYFKKGDLVFIDGIIKQKRWTHNDSNHSQIVLNLNGLELMARAKKNESEPPKKEEPKYNHNDDDIPF